MTTSPARAALYALTGRFTPGYERSLAVLEDMIPGHPLVERLAAELRPLRAALERSGVEAA